MTRTQDGIGSVTLNEVLAELAERREEFREQRYVSPDFVARLDSSAFTAPTPSYRRNTRSSARRSTTLRAPS
jgi:hypothetical protein